MPFFSVIIATRNRPALFREALQSVVVQSLSDIEIIVVNDGSAIGHQPEYGSIVRALGSRRIIRSFDLTSRGQGHGGAYARNFGAARADAAYLCFLDDDDCWIDEHHLSRARSIIADSMAPVDLYMTNQDAFFNGERRIGPIWIEDLPTILHNLNNQPDRHGAYTVTVDELLQSHGFCHLNTLIVRRGLYDEIGGMEESIRWEEDRDFYLRLIDRAGVMKYFPVTVARHNIPDPRAATSMTTTLSDIERRIFQLKVFDRALHLVSNPAIRAHALQHKGYTLKRIAESLANAGRYHEAAHYAREALRSGFTIKWAGYTAWLTLRALSG